MARSPRPPWVLSPDTSCTSPDTCTSSPIFRACAKQTTRNGAFAKCSGREKSPDTDEGSEAERAREECSKRRWGLGIFVHERYERTEVIGPRTRMTYSVTQSQVARKSLRTESIERSSVRPSSVVATCPKFKDYCARACESACAFRPKTSIFGYRTPLAYRQGYGCERLGCIFASREGCGTAIPEREPRGYGLSTKRGSGKYTAVAVHSPTVSLHSTQEPEKTSGADSAEKVASSAENVAAGSKETVAGSIEKFAGSTENVAGSKEKIAGGSPELDPSIDQMKKCRHYTSEFLCRNPCVSILPWMDKKKKGKKKRKKVVITAPVKKCLCSVNVNTLPMTNDKFTEMDVRATDQCTWMDVPRTDRGVGTEVTTVDQYTHVTELDLDGSPPDYYSSVAETPLSIKSSIRPSIQPSIRPSIRSSEPSLRESVASSVHEEPPPPEMDLSCPENSHSLVSDPGSAGLPRSSCVNVPASFTRMSLGCGKHGAQTGTSHIPWDGIVSRRGKIVCCPPCVGDPVVLGRFWRHTPKFTDVVRTPPFCDCCEALLYEDDLSHCMCK